MRFVVLPGGSLGLGGATNAGDAHRMAQAQHGSAPDIQGQDEANRCSLVLSAAILLRWIADKRDRPDLRRGAEAVGRAVDGLVKHPETRRRDLGGPLGIGAFTRKLRAEIERSP